MRAEAGVLLLRLGVVIVKVSPPFSGLCEKLPRAMSP